MSKLATGVLIAASILLAVAAAQPVGDPDRAIQKLQEDVLLIEGRLETLEALAAMEAPAYFGGKAAKPAAKASGPPDHVMKLTGVEAADADPEARQEVERMQHEVDALERQVQSQQANALRSGSYGNYRSGARESREREAEGDVYAAYNQEFKKKQGEVKKLERELSQPKQIILGSWDGKIITLTTTKDLTPKLNKIDVGGYPTWDGRRIREDEVSQDWVVWDVDRVDPWEIE